MTRQARVKVNNSNNIDTRSVSIADLAQFCKLFKNKSSDQLNIYMVQLYMEKEYPFEIEHFEYEIGTGYTAYFKDGSELFVAAWADADDQYWYGPNGETRIESLYEELNGIVAA